MFFNDIVCSSCKLYCNHGKLSIIIISARLTAANSQMTKRLTVAAQSVPPRSCERRSSSGVTEWSPIRDPGISRETFEKHVKIVGCGLVARDFQASVVDMAACMKGEQKVELYGIYVLWYS